MTLLIVCPACRNEQEVLPERAVVVVGLANATATARAWVAFPCDPCARIVTCQASVDNVGILVLAGLTVRHVTQHECGPSCQAISAPEVDRAAAELAALDDVVAAALGGT